MRGDDSMYTNQATSKECYSGDTSNSLSIYLARLRFHNPYLVGLRLLIGVTSWVKNWFNQNHLTSHLIYHREILDTPSCWENSIRHLKPAGQIWVGKLRSTPFQRVFEIFPATWSFYVIFHSKYVPRIYIANPLLAGLNSNHPRSRVWSPTKLSGEPVKFMALARH